MAMNPASDNLNANFRVDINNYLNVKHGLYRDILRGVALSEPAKYFAYRQNVQDYVKTSAISNLYNVIFNALKDGKKVDGTAMCTTMIGGSPNVSEQKINEIAISIGKTLDEMLEQVIELICPSNIQNYALERTAAKGNALGIN